MKMKHILFLMLVLVFVGCAPYALAVKETYEVAADPRSLVTQATDTQAELQIKAALLASPVRGTSGIDVLLPPGGRGARGCGATGLASGSGGGGDRAPDARR